MLQDRMPDSYGQGAMPFRDTVKKMHSRCSYQPRRRAKGVRRYQPVFLLSIRLDLLVRHPGGAVRPVHAVQPGREQPSERRISDVELGWVGNRRRQCRHTRSFCLLRLPTCYLRGALATVRQEKGGRMGVLHPWPLTHPDMGGWDSGRRVHCRQPRLPIRRGPSVDDPTIAVETKQCQL